LKKSWVWASAGFHASTVFSTILPKDAERVALPLRIALSLHLRGWSVHWCSQQRGYPGVPLEKYTAEDRRRDISRKALRATLHRLLRAANRGGG